MVDLCKLQLHGPAHLADAAELRQLFVLGFKVLLCLCRQVLLAEVQVLGSFDLESLDQRQEVFCQKPVLSDCKQVRLVEVVDANHPVSV